MVYVFAAHYLQPRAVRLKTWSSRKHRRTFVQGFSTLSFQFCAITKTKSSEMKTSEFFPRHFDQTVRYFDQTLSFSSSEFSILHYTKNGKQTRR